MTTIDRERELLEANNRYLARARAAEDEAKTQANWKDAVYLERNKLVALLASIFPSGVKQAAIEGWSEDWHGCVYIDFPWGQASWHFHTSQAHLFAHLPPYHGSFDGHTTEEKYDAIVRETPNLRERSPHAVIKHIVSVLGDHDDAQPQSPTGSASRKTEALSVSVEQPADVLGVGQNHPANAGYESVTRERLATDLMLQAMDRGLVTLVREAAGEGRVRHVATANFCTASPPPSSHVAPVGWFEFDPNTGEFTGKWCSVKPADPRDYRPLYGQPSPQTNLDGNRPLPYDRETLGRFVREAWVRWAETQPNPKPSWLVPYDELSEPDKEADRQIGEALARWTLIGDAARASLSPPPQTNVEGLQPCGLPDPSTRDCPNMKEVGGGMDGERYRCAVCGKGYFLDYEEMK